MVQKSAALLSQTDILTPAVWKHLLAWCSTEQHGWNGLQLSAALVLRYAGISLRYKHTKRTIFSPELSSSRAFVWKITNRKKRARFHHLHYEVRNWLGETAAFMPEHFFAHDGTVCLDERLSRYLKFQALFQSLLTLPPLVISAVDAPNFRTYSMRRLLPSVADCFQLNDAERNCLGNWHGSFAFGSP